MRERERECKCKCSDVKAKEERTEIAFQTLKVPTHLISLTIKSMWQSRITVVDKTRNILMYIYPISCLSLFE